MVVVFTAAMDSDWPSTRRLWPQTDSRYSVFGRGCLRRKRGSWVL